MKKKIKLLLIIFCLIIASLIFVKVFLKHNDTDIDNKINITNVAIDYSYVGIPKNGYIAVSNGTNFGYINLSTTKILGGGLNYHIPKDVNLNYQLFLLDCVFIDGLAPIIDEGGHYGLIDNSGKEIIKPQYSFIKVISKNSIIVSKDGYYYFIDSSNKKISNNIYQIIKINENNDSLFIVNSNGKYGVVTSEDKVLLDGVYDEVFIDKDDEGKNFVIQADKDNIIENYYYHNNNLEKLDNCENLQLSFVSNNKIYYIDDQGMYSIYDINTKKIVTLKEKYVAIGGFNNNLSLAINSDMKIGFINQFEEIVIPYKYGYNLTTDFDDNGLAVVEIDGFTGVIDMEGKEVLPCIYRDITIIDKNRFIVYDQADRVTIIDNNGLVVIDDNYSSIYPIVNFKYLLVSKKQNSDEVYGIIDYDGNEIIPIKYEKIDIYNDYLLLKVNTNQYIIRSDINNLANYEQKN